MCTIFSAPNYCGSEGNSASVMHISAKLEVSFITLKPKISVAERELTKEELAILHERILRSNAKSPKPGLY